MSADARAREAPLGRTTEAEPKGTLRRLRLAEWRRIVGATPLQLSIPIALSACIAALEGASVGLLVPMAVGVTDRDFSFVRDLPLFSSVIAMWPEVFTPGPDTFAPLFFLLAVTAFLAVVAKNVLSYASHLLTSRWNGLYLRRANEHLFRRCLGFGKLYFDRTNQGSLQAVLGHTGELVDLLTYLQRGALHLLTLLAYLVLLFWISWRLALFVIAFFPITHLLVRGLTRTIERLSRQLNEATLTRHATAYSILSALPLFTAYGQERQAARRYAENAEQLRRLNFRINAVQGLLHPFQEIMIVTTVLGTIGFLAFRLAAREPDELAVFLVFFFAVRTALPRFMGLYEVFVEVVSKAPKLADLASLLEDGEKHIVAGGSIELGELESGISVRNLRFEYLPGAPVLDGVSAEFPRGTTTALVGPTGAGKSTLVHLLMGFYPAPDGAIRIDGRVLSSLAPASLRANVALVSQDLFVFDDTLRANLLMGAPEGATDDQLYEALGKARLREFVEGLPDGLDTRVGDRGVQLSGGERQRVAICRAFLRRPTILILDEATSALDGETEAQIQDALRELMAGRTAIVIAHRLSTIRDADQIVFLEGGRVVESGRPSDLLARGGRFADFWNAQQIARDGVAESVRSTTEQ